MLVGVIGGVCYKWLGCKLLESGSGDGRCNFFTLVVVDGGWLLVMVDIVGSHCYS